MGVVAFVLLVSGAIYIALPFTAVRFAQAPFIGFLMGIGIKLVASGYITYYFFKELILAIF